MELNHSHWISCRGLETLGSDQKPDSRISLGYIYMEEGKARAIFVVGRYMEIRKRRTAAPANKEKRQNSSDYKRLRININLHGLELLGVILITIALKSRVSKNYEDSRISRTQVEMSLFLLIQSTCIQLLRNQYASFDVAHLFLGKRQYSIIKCVTAMMSPFSVNKYQANASDLLTFRW